MSLSEWMKEMLENNRWTMKGPKKQLEKVKIDDYLAVREPDMKTQLFAKNGSQIVLVTADDDTSLYVSQIWGPLKSGIIPMRSLEPGATLIENKNGVYTFSGRQLDSENSSAKEQSKFFNMWYKKLRALAKERNITIKACAHCGEKPATLNCSECKRDFCSPECAAQAE